MLQSHENKITELRVVYTNSPYTFMLNKLLNLRPEQLTTDSGWVYIDSTTATSVLRYFSTRQLNFDI